MSALFGTVGTFTPSPLLADPQGAELIAIPCEPGNGSLSRGQIMYQKASGFFAPAATGHIIGTNNLVVLDQDVDTSANATVAEDARAFRAARLLSSKLIIAGGGTLTAAHKLVLRQQGIVLEVMVAVDATFDNAFVVVTYKANGGTGDDVVVSNVQINSDYTIAANTFDPPAGKVFSKWNTATDGTGTDYAAAATYTAIATLTLFAVWVDA